jgi:hypothetical protein
MTQEMYNPMLSGRGKDLYSTGSYGKDVGVGLLSGLNYAFNRPGEYYVKANWSGNGLANTGLGYMSNPDYTNPYDAMNALTSTLYEGKKDKKEKDRDTFGSMKERLSTMLGKPLFGIDNSNPYGLNTKEYALPEVAGVGGGTIGGGYNPQYYSYGLPTQSLDFNKFWE